MSNIWNVLPPTVRNDIRHPEQVEDCFPIRCGEERHYLALINKKLVPLNHNFYHARNVMMLGGELPECMQAMKVWYAKQPVTYPASMRDAYLRAHREDRIRQYNKKTFASSLCYTRYPAIALEGVKETYIKTQQIVRLLLKYKCGYQLLNQRDWDLKIDMMHEEHCHPNVMCSTHTAMPHLQAKDAAHFSIVHLEIERTWLDKVWNWGVAVVDGMLCLHHYVSPTPDKRRRHDVYAARMMYEQVDGVSMEPYFTTRDCDLYWGHNDNKPHVLRWHSSPFHSVTPRGTPSP